MISLSRWFGRAFRVRCIKAVLRTCLGCLWFFSFRNVCCFESIHPSPYTLGTDRKTPSTLTLILRYSLESPVDLDIHVFGLWKTIGIPVETPCSHMKNMLTKHRKAVKPTPILPSQWDTVAVLFTEPLLSTALQHSNRYLEGNVKPQRAMEKYDGGVVFIFSQSSHIKLWIPQGCDVKPNVFSSSWICSWL